MLDPIEKIGISPASLEPPQLKAPPVGPSSTGPAQGKTFKDALSEAVGEVQRLQNEADTTIRQLVSGELKDVTEAMVAVEKADLSFQSMMLVRNKIVAAYEEVMRMQV
jgi:flagellar hook-basal body complex protein FliE